MGEQRDTRKTGKARHTYKYQVKLRGEVVHIGITADLKRRERQHNREFPGAEIKPIGRRTTREAARRWERTKVDRVKIEPKELQKLSPGIRSKLLKHKDKILGILDKRG